MHKIHGWNTPETIHGQQHALEQNDIQMNPSALQTAPPSILI